MNKNTKFNFSELTQHELDLQPAEIPEEASNAPTHIPVRKSTEKTDWWFYFLLIICMAGFGVSGFLVNKVYYSQLKQEITTQPKETIPPMPSFCFPRISEDWQYDVMLLKIEEIQKSLDNMEKSLDNMEKNNEYSRRR